ncbi:MAG: tetratricopeptide repeat protein, partial [Planctomycetota bacterium]|nr:tetratricopeptide repeat protein [Planctomycetota bacterium]
YKDDITLWFDNSHKTPNVHHVRQNLATAYFAAGRFPEAVREAEQALALAKSSKHDSLTAEIAERLELYKRQQPFRETAPAEGGTKQHP